jgi:hypothetical protein
VPEKFFLIPDNLPKAIQLTSSARFSEFSKMSETIELTDSIDKFFKFIGLQKAQKLFVADACPCHKSLDPNKA